MADEEIEVKRNWLLAQLPQASTFQSKDFYLGPCDSRAHAAFLQGQGMKGVKGGAIPVRCYLLGWALGFFGSCLPLELKSPFAFVYVSHTSPRS